MGVEISYVALRTSESNVFQSIAQKIAGAIGVNCEVVMSHHRNYLLWTDVIFVVIVKSDDETLIKKFLEIIKNRKPIECLSNT